MSQTEHHLALTEPQPEPGPQLEPSPATGVANAAEVTPAGFRRRRRGFEGAPGGSDSISPLSAVPIERKARDPHAVGAFLSNFRSGVHHGRMQVSASESFELEMSPPVAPEGGNPHA
ncbi:MAG: hypothetical protein O3C27_06380 [Actinomycetota bacterium]|nr:hypothetical protein [Actinomycetota bacterium]